MYHFRGIMIFMFVHIIMDGVVVVVVVFVIVVVVVVTFCYDRYTSHLKPQRNETKLPTTHQHWLRLEVRFFYKRNSTRIAELNPRQTRNFLRIDQLHQQSDSKIVRKLFILCSMKYFNSTDKMWVIFTIFYKNEIKNIYVPQGSVFMGLAWVHGGPQSLFFKTNQNSTKFQKQGKSNWKMIYFQCN